jgi:hypothetical protein
MLLSLYFSYILFDISMLILIPLSIKTLSFQTDFKEVTYGGNLNIFYSKEKTLESIKYFLDELNPNENYVCIINIIQDMTDFNESDMDNCYL